MRFEAVKFVHHATDHPEDPVLRARPLGADELAAFYRSLRRALGEGDERSPDALLATVWRRAAPVPALNAEREGFDPIPILDGSASLYEDDAFFTFGDSNDVWKMGRSDLSRFFDSIWYPGPDDLLIVDAVRGNALAINHSGNVSRFEPAVPLQGGAAALPKA